MALDSDKRRIQAFEKQLADSKRDVFLLKKIAAFFIRDNPALKWLHEWEKLNKTWICPIYVSCLMCQSQTIITIQLINQTMLDIVKS